MTKLELIAKSIAQVVHEKQVRTDGSPYITHPEAVANFFETEEERVLGWLHDVIEDSDYTPEKLIALGIPEHLVAILVILTRKEAEAYVEYILRIVKSPLATSIKLADLEHNISTCKSKHQKDKYELAYYILDVVGDLDIGEVEW